MFCGKCGNTLDDATRFCPKCGAAVNHSPITSTAATESTPHAQPSPTPARAAASTFPTKLVAVIVAVAVVVAAAAAVMFGLVLNGPSSKSDAWKHQETTSTYADWSQIRAYFQARGIPYDDLDTCRLYEMFDDETVMLLLQYREKPDEQFEFAMFACEYGLGDINGLFSGLEVWETEEMHEAADGGALYRISVAYAREDTRSTWEPLIYCSDEGLVQRIVGLFDGATLGFGYSFSYDDDWQIASARWYYGLDLSDGTSYDFANEDSNYKEWHYSYDSDGRLAEVAEADRHFVCDYDADGQRSGVHLDGENGFSASYTRNNAGFVAHASIETRYYRDTQSDKYGWADADEYDIRYRQADGWPECFHVLSSRDGKTNFAAQYDEYGNCTYSKSVSMEGSTGDESTTEFDYSYGTGDRAIASVTTKVLSSADYTPIIYEYFDTAGRPTYWERYANEKLVSYGEQVSYDDETRECVFREYVMNTSGKMQLSSSDVTRSYINPPGDYYLFTDE